MFSCFDVRLKTILVQKRTSDSLDEGLTIKITREKFQTNLFAYSCRFTFHTSYKNGMIGHGGGTMSKCSKTLYYKTLLETYFVKYL